MDEFLLAGISAAIGSIVTLAWEAVLKPRRERYAIASALAGELASNARTIELRLVHEPPPDVRALVRDLSDTVYTACVPRLGELLFEDTLRVTEMYASINNLKRREWKGFEVHRSEEGPIVPVEAQRIQAARLFIQDHETTMLHNDAQRCLLVGSMLMSRYRRGWRAFVPGRWQRPVPEMKRIFAHAQPMPAAESDARTAEMMESFKRAIARERGIDLEGRD